MKNPNTSYGQLIAFVERIARTKMDIELSMETIIKPAQAVVHEDDAVPYDEWIMFARFLTREYPEE